MNIEFYLKPCGNEDFIDLGKCKGYERLCGPYGISLEYCDIFLPVVGKLNQKFSLHIANDYFEKLDNAYRDNLIGLLFEKIKKLPPTGASYRKIKSFNKKKQSFIEKPFSKKFFEHVRAETSNKIYNRVYTANKPRSISNAIYHDSTKREKTIFTAETIENLNEIVRKNNEGKGIEDHDRKILVEVFGNNKRVNNFLNFLERAYDINNVMKP
jgi:hypothetical protein